MADALPGLGRRPADPPMPVCAVCGPTWAASRGFPGGVSYCREHVPAALRFPWEVGSGAPEAAPAPAPPAPGARVVPFSPRPARPAAQACPSDLFGPGPA